MARPPVAVFLLPKLPLRFPNASASLEGVASEQRGDPRIVRRADTPYPLSGDWRCSQVSPSSRGNLIQPIRAGECGLVEWMAVDSIARGACRRPAAERGTGGTAYAVAGETRINVSHEASGPTFAGIDPGHGAEVTGDRAMPLQRVSFEALAGLARSVRELGVYAAIALVLPGGSLIVLAVWAFRHRRRLRDLRKAQRRCAPAASPAPVVVAGTRPADCR
jgi:hypothetical protein